MTTPMRAQYLALKRQFPDVILFFRLGDFYETFDDDAKIVSSVCDVVLTSRPVGADLRVPLAGVPYHAVDGYIARLIRAGYKVAIAEQVGNEPPKGEKLVPRVVRRVVTPGTLVEPEMLPSRANNYLAALVADAGHAGLAYADISTGEFAATEFAGEDTPRRVLEEIARLAPAEVLVPSQERAGGPGAAAADLLAASGVPCHITAYGAWHFEPETASQALAEHFAVRSLSGFGLEPEAWAARAAGALIQYLNETQRQVAQSPSKTPVGGSARELGTPRAPAHEGLAGFRLYSTSEFMTLDQVTRRNLELTESIRDGSASGSLLAVLDLTVTPMGGRLLRRWMGQPLLDPVALNARLDAVQSWLERSAERAELRAGLKGLGDVERRVNRVVQGIATPRELVGLRQALARVEQVREILGCIPGRRVFPGPGDAPPDVDPCADVADLLSRALADDPPASPSATGIIRPGYSAELDGIHLAVRDAREWIAALEGVERGRTGIKSLRVGYNKVFGYYIEITRANASLVPEDYIRKQTLVNAERYITPELKEYEALVLNAEERILDLEGQIYRELLGQVAGEAGRLLATSGALAELDMAAALAEVAEVNRYVRPEIDSGDVIEIKGGRHPVVEKLLSGEAFTPNDATLSPEAGIVILTGPNMSGKSTFIRQVAMIVLMAQIGSFVPADHAHIGIVDRVFTRIGASDEIARGRSTFMVEMVETANILHNATNRSLLIFDEIGRGTSTYDGLAIAWAVVEYIHNHPHLRAKTLFATHYHELTDLADRLPHVVNCNVAVAEQGDQVVFLHRIIPGGADRSYGVHVAQLAGMPRAVVNRAQEILAELEASGAAGPGRRSVGPPIYQLSLFSGEHPILIDLANLDVNALSPLEALNRLFELQQRARKRVPFPEAGSRDGNSG